MGQPIQEHIPAKQGLKLIYMKITVTDQAIFRNTFQQNKDWNSVNSDLLCLWFFIQEHIPAKQGLKQDALFVAAAGFGEFRNTFQQNKDWNVE